jgi:hypothetical protein
MNDRRSRIRYSGLLVSWSGCSTLDLIKLQNRIIGLAGRVALALLGFRLRLGLDVIYANDTTLPSRDL